MTNRRSGIQGDRFLPTRLTPASDTRDPNAGAVGCFVGFPIAILTFVGVTYLSIQFGITAGEFTTTLALLGIAASILVARGISNSIADQWRELALRNIDSPTVSIAPKKVRVGDLFMVIYHQKVPKPIVIRQLVMQLVRVTTLKREILDIQDDFHKDETIHQGIRRKGRNYKPGDIFHREVLFTIPRNAPPSTDTDSVAEQWLIHVHLYLEGQADFERDYVLQVE